MAVPQICGGLGPPGFEIENTSVKHLDARETSFGPPVPTVCPPTALASVAVTVFAGPFITKVIKSSLS